MMFDDEEDEGFDGNLSEDLEKFEAYLKGDEIGFMDSDRLEALIDHFLINNQYTKAKICAEHAITQFAYSPLFYLRKAQAISALGQLKEALKILNQIEKWEAPTCELLLTKASIFSQLRDQKNAIKYFKQALSLSEPEDRDEIYLDLAMEYVNLGDYKHAVSILKEAIANNPHNEGAIYEIAFCYDQLGEYEQAIKCYSDFLDENPYSFTAWYNLGNAYSKLEDYDKAIWAYDYCLVINEDFGPACFNLGSAYLSSEEYTKAVTYLERCIELDGEDAVALSYLGEAYEQLNELAKARHCYSRSVELAPALPDSWLGLGILEDLEGNTEEALTFLHKAAELDPENAGVYHVLAGAYEKLNDFDAAEEYYRLSLRLDPSDEECLIDFLQLLSDSSILEAYRFVKEFKHENQQNKIVPLLEVNMLWLMGKRSEALELFKACVEDDRLKAKEIFIINPDLTNVEEFVHLTED
jgi:tetratricopeptide (TPR) repeat protein